MAYCIVGRRKKKKKAQLPGCVCECLCLFAAPQKGCISIFLLVFFYSQYFITVASILPTRLARTQKRSIAWVFLIIGKRLVKVTLWTKRTWISSSQFRPPRRNDLHLAPTSRRAHIRGEWRGSLFRMVQCETCHQKQSDKTSAKAIAASLTVCSVCHLNKNPNLLYICEP